VLQINAAELVIGAAAGKGEKHHYIPVFYSREWAGPDGRLCEYTRPYREVKPQWKHPDATGYVRGLYTVPGSEPGVSEYIEHHFFRITDNGAAVVAQQLRAGGPIDWFNMDRSSWSRFIISLMLRNPDAARFEACADSSVGGGRAEHPLDSQGSWGPAADCQPLTASLCRPWP
jgi:hypothetical protein